MACDVCNERRYTPAPEYEYTCKKPAADIYVDDRAFAFNRQALRQMKVMADFVRLEKKKTGRNTLSGRVLGVALMTASEGAKMIREYEEDLRCR